MITDKTHKIIYVAGLSKDGSKFYVDRDLPDKITQKDGTVYNPTDYLKYHEQVEFKLMEHGMGFNEAHRTAIRKEKEKLKRDGINEKQYYNMIYDLVEKNFKSVSFEDEPKDLDTRPYDEDNLTEIDGEIVPPSGNIHDFIEREKMKDINT